MQSLNAANSPRARVQSCPVLLARLGRKHQVVGVGDLPKHVDYSAKNPAIFLAQHRAKVQSLSRLKERPVSTGHLLGYLSYCTLKKHITIYIYIYLFIFIYLSIYLFSLSLSLHRSLQGYIYIYTLHYYVLIYLILFVYLLIFISHILLSSLIHWGFSLLCNSQ